MRTATIGRPLAGLLALVALALGACGGDDDGTSMSGDAGVDAAATVRLKPVTFEPETATIKVGESVKWEWEGGVQHNVNGEGFKSELKRKGTFSHTFEAAGTFDYKCDVHPTTMKGTITVE